MTRLHLAVVCVAVQIFAASCASKPKSRIDSVPEAPSQPAGDLIVLLRDADGGVGRAIVSNRLGSVDLQHAGAATRVSAGQPPSEAQPLTDPELAAIFGEALASLPLPPERFTVFFKFESDDLTAESAAALEAVVAAVSRHQPADVAVVGHADAAGSARSNYQLGLRRAERLRDILSAAGIDKSAIDVSSHGEADPAVTADKLFERRNRRVDITVR